MELYERILSKEEINRRFIIAVTAVMANKLNSSKTGLAESLDVKPAKFSEILNGRMNVGTDMIAKICDYYDVSPDWLLLSRGNNVFRQVAKQTIWIDDDNLNMKYTEDGMPDNKTSEEGTMDHSPEKVQSASSDVVTLRLMEKIDEKDIKIDELQSELRQKSEELAALKAKYHQSQDKEPESPPLAMPGTAEDFTENSYGDYGEGFSPTKPPTTSKRLSGGKM